MTDLLSTTATFGNCGTIINQGKHIGDLFNGIVSLISYRRKNNLLDVPTYISVPEHRYEIVEFFKKANCIPVTSDSYIDIHINSLKKSSSVFLYEYFSCLDLNEEDIFDDFYFSHGKPFDDVTEDDIIIFPVTSGAEILDYSLFINYIEDQKINYKSIFWNTEPSLLYRENYNKESKTINLSIADLIFTIREKNPTIIGHRSGIFDLIFSLVPDSKVHCFYDTRDKIQMDWRFKSNNPVHYEKYINYINRRKNFKEIFV